MYKIHIKPPGERGYNAAPYAEAENLMVAYDIASDVLRRNLRINHIPFSVLIQHKSGHKTTIEIKSSEISVTEPKTKTVML